MSSILLASSAITLKRPGAKLLQFPDISITRSHPALLLGPSGSGKTSLLSIIAGLLRPTSGEVFLEGNALYRMPSATRDFIRGRRFGFVFQTLHLLPSLTLRQNIALAADMTGGKPDPQRLTYLLNTLGLADKAHRKPSALSQGEQQRAAIARAVLHRPAIIIADEPTSALDDRNAKAVIDLLVGQAAENEAALLIATHDTRIIDRFEKIIRLDSQMKEAA